MQKNKGITLIVLIITIIIMLILVGVVIDVTVDGSLFDKAQTAVDRTNETVSQTQNRVDELMGKLNEISNEDTKLQEFTLTYLAWDSLEEDAELIGTFEFEQGQTWREFIGDEVFDKHGWPPFASFVREESGWRN